MSKRPITIVAADLAGYSRLMARDEQGVIDQLRRIREAHIAPVVASFGGRVVKTMGDGMLVEFPSPLMAVRAVLAFQTAMVEAGKNVPPDERMLFRVGINQGDVFEDGGEIMGDVINIAARLESLAPPGGICISRSVRECLSDLSDLRITDLGEQFVKNIPHAVEVWRIEIRGVVASQAVEGGRAARTTVAVLPFSTLSHEPDDAILGDAVADDITTRLARFRALTVIARSSAFTFRDKGLAMPEIGRALGVKYIVSGSLQKVGDRLRLSVQLCEAETGFQIWTGRWDGTSGDIFALQDEAVVAVIGGLAPELGAHERSLARAGQAGNLSAWELCHRGLGEFFKYHRDAYPVAAEYFAASIAADQNFALPRALLARLHAVLVYSGHSQNPVGDITKGMAHATAAIQLDDRLDEAHIALAALLVPQGREAEARAALARAQALNDNNVGAYQVQTFVNLFQPQPDPDEMEAAADMALRLSPTDPRAWAFHWAATCARWIRDGRLDENVRAHLEAACALPQVEYFTILAAAVMNVRLGQRDEAQHLLDRAMAKRPGLTLREHTSSFRFPYWAKLKHTIDAEYDQLVEMGLPRG